MFRKKWLMAILFIATLVISLIVGNLKTEYVTAQDNADKKLVMVTSADYPPYQFRQTDSGNSEIVGFDIDIAKYITKKLGYKLEIRDTDFSGIIPALQSGRADFAMSGMTPTAERKKNVAFSDLYYEAKNTIVSQKTSNLKNTADLAGKKVGVELGTTQEKTAKSLKDVQVVALNRPGSIIQELKSKRLDAAILEDTVAKGYVANNPELTYEPIPTTSEEVGSAIAFPKNSPLVNSFNQVLQEMKQNGELQKLITKWFGSDGAKVSSYQANNNAANAATPSNTPIAQNTQNTGRKLIMVTSADYPPYEFRKTGSGNDIIGFDVDIAKYITRELGYELEIKDTDFSGIIPALQSGRANFAMAGMTPTPERLKNVDFSDIYYEAKNTIVSKKGSNLTTIASLAGKKVGVQLGSTQEKFAKEKIKGAKIVALNKTGDLIQEIKSNRISAAIIEDAIAKGFIANNPDLEFTTIPNSSEEAGSAIAFPKGSPLVQPFNKVLQQMKQNGEMDALVKKWFENQGGNQAAEEQKKPSSFETAWGSIPFIAQGIIVTLQFTLISSFFGFLWGIVLALFKISTIKPLNIFAKVYTSVFRGTPLLLQIALVYYATPQLTGYDIPALLAGVITFTLNSGAYISETIRGGILAVDKGQREAALSLGVPYQPMMKDIILPQAVKNILPSLVNESIALLKDSSLVSTIGVVDVLRRAQIVGAEKYIYFEPLLVAGLIYYVLVMLLTWGGSKLERRLQRSA
ncbi:ABC transporter substrate-binding protein/permease [[Phormidium] sp. LEGE 05292]|uniref:ABC transporter substrate-binding protein/permease n=1 Tax=[Phormidium] sp. LEGE 05292 TaxID=767427 RepID=UPI001D1332AA|nr:ABC transporter substrate-binding protein/permease [Phormidium sp. LEGE 05292]